MKAMNFLYHIILFTYFINGVQINYKFKIIFFNFFFLLTFPGYVQKVQVEKHVSEF